MRAGEGPLVLFDAECPLCRTFSQIARKMGFETVSIQESADMLEKIMGERFPFSLYLIEAGWVHWGREALRRLLEIKGFGVLSYAAYVLYPMFYFLNRNAKIRNQSLCRCMLHGRKRVWQAGSQ